MLHDHDGPHPAAPSEPSRETAPLNSSEMLSADISVLIAEADRSNSDYPYTLAQRLADALRTAMATSQRLTEELDKAQTELQHISHRVGFHEYGPDAAVRQKLIALHDALAAAESRASSAEKERNTWRWLHWGKTDASWACPCGNALGSGMEKCPDCNALRPATPRRAALAALPQPPKS